jgi:S1-C subfamily serine protease
LNQHLIVGGCALIGGLSACAIAVAQAPASPAAPATADAAPKVEFAKMRSKVMPGDKIGSAEGGWLCIGKHDMKASEQIERVFDAEGQLAFKKAATALGLPLATREVSAFDTGGPSDADYRVGGVVNSMDAQICTYPPENRKGSITFEVKWDLFSTRQQRVVLSKTTAGTYAKDSFESMSVRDSEVNAFTASLRNFFEDAEVKQLMSGAAPAMPAMSFAAMHLAGGAVVTGTTVQSADALRNAVVTISSDVGMGSGFYVADGYVLTDRHVVGSSKYVKVKLASGKEMIGEVVRADGPRDVALLKTDSAGVPSIRMRLGDPAVGEEVWAIGSPLNQVLAGTVTRGVLSGMREDEGVRFFQSDVAINPGNSGGPLIDAQGNAIGLTRMKVSNAAGLAFFVPIRDALDRLALVVDTPVAAATVTTATTATTTVKKN